MMRTLPFVSVISWRDKSPLASFTERSASPVETPGPANAREESRKAMVEPVPAAAVPLATWRD